MSGYRTLHRIQPHPSTPSLWHVRFSPSLRLLAAGASDQIRIYSLRERTQSNASDALDATPLIVECVECLVPTDYVADSNCVLGYGALDVVRNYCGADMYAGNEVVIASRLGGRVGVWVRLDPALNATKQVEPSSTTVDGMAFIRPDVEFTVPNATGTTCAIRPPSMANYYSDEKDLLIAMGCADGSVLLCRSGILAAKPGKTIGSAGIVGDSSSFTRQVIDIASNSTPGQVITTVGGGHACVLSIVWHPSLPDTFVVGRKDGAVDIYSSQYGMCRRVHRLIFSTCGSIALCRGRWRRIVFVRCLRHVHFVFGI
jgi:WD40 repeat protein